MKTLKDFLQTLHSNTFVVVFIGGCSMADSVEGHLKNEKLCNNIVKKIYKYPTNYAVDLKL